MMGNKGVLPIMLLIFCSLLVALPIIETVRAAEDQWITFESMPTARAIIGVAVVDGKIYAIGGSYDSCGVEEYDPVTNTWTTKTPMPTPRIFFGISVVENKIYVIGGDSGDWTVGITPTNVNEVYDPETDTWTTKTPIPVRVEYYTSVFVDNKIYVIGGAVKVTLNQIYDTETDTWSNGAPLPKGVDAAAAAVTTGVFAPKRIYVIGGKQNLAAVNLTQIYDPETDTWSTGTPMPTARYGLGVAVVNDKLYAIGGREGWIGAPISAANEQYTPVGYIPEFPSWTPLLIMLIAVMAVAVIYRRILRQLNRVRIGQ